jgi:hypothetical protein
MNGDRILRIFMMPQEFPCGEQSSCCGPVGQSEDEIQSLKSGMEGEFGYEVEVLNVKDDVDIKNHAQIVQLVQSLGVKALPILTVEDEVVSVGNPTPEKAVAAIRESMDKKEFGKENEMIEKDNSERSRTQESTSDMEPCCCSGSDSDCCPSGADDGGGRNWKMVVFILIVVTAGVVLARSLLSKSSSSADETQPFVAIEPAVNSTAPSPPSSAAIARMPAESEVKIEKLAVVDETRKEVPEEAAPALWGAELDSFASLNQLAAGVDAVFVLVAAEGEQKMQPITGALEAAAGKIQSKGSRVSAFTLKRDSTNYAQLVKQFSAPCVVTMVKGRGMSVVSGEITEPKLMQAFVAASRARSACCPGGAPCPPKTGKPCTK